MIAANSLNTCTAHPFLRPHPSYGALQIVLLLLLWNSLLKLVWGPTEWYVPLALANHIPSP